MRWIVKPFYLLCDSVFGEHHTHGHRMAAGSVVIAVGTAVAGFGAHFKGEFIHLVFDGVGFMIHGFGVVPFAEIISYAIRNNR